MIATSIHGLSVAHRGIAQRISRLHVNPNATACFEQSAGSNNLDVDCGRLSRGQAFARGRVYGLAEWMWNDLDLAADAMREATRAPRNRAPCR
jgi:hypothetical protein